MKAALEGRATADRSFREHIDRCLGCMACVTACPSGVQYGRLIEYARPQVAEEERPVSDRLFRALIFSLFPHPRRLIWAARALRLAQLFKIRELLRRSGLTSLLPARLAALERIAPTVISREAAPPPVLPPAGTKRKRVGLLLGCVQRVFFADVNAATARVLSSEGCEVVVPPEQGCCGALMLHAGRLDDAREAAKRLVDVFDRAAVGHIVINAAGCGSAMKEYADLLRDDPNYADRARRFAERCVDVAELLAGLEPRAIRHPLRLRVAYQDACHLQHAQRIREEPRRVLRTIPGIDLVDVGESDMCCGSAGVYNLLEPEPAAALRDRKVDQVRATAADVLVSSNPGCLLQIGSGLRAAGDRIRTQHLVQLLDASIHGSGAQPR
jgi:glycolate oxidase iron-sulfur subunit